MGTDEVYGPIATGSWKEDSPLNPTNPYSSTKAAADLLALTYQKTYKLPIILVRAENIYGPFQHPEKVIPNWTKRALNDESLLMYGDGKYKRMWLHLEDATNALVFLLEHGNLGEIYNIAGEEELENLDLAKMILKILDKPEDKITFVPDEKIRPFHDRRYSIYPS